jgi:hypothetical protein
MFFASIVLAIVAIAAPLVMHACAAGRIPVNHLVGIRTASVMASPGAWRAGHRAAIPSAWIGAIVALVLAGISLSPSLSDDTESGVLIAAAIALLVAVIVGGLFANRAALAQLASEQEQEQPKTV